MNRIISAAIIAGLGFTATASASDLARINAVSCGHAAKAGSGVAEITGSSHKRGARQTFATERDMQFPAMVKLQMVYQHDGYAEIEHCGGTVIDSRYIVTAAHCVTADAGEAWDRIEITAGGANLESGKVIRRVANDAICHAGHDPFLANDMALIKLDAPLPKEIVPARIDDFRRPSVKPGGIAVSAGWPVTGANAGETVLRKTPLSVKDVEWPGFITVTSPTGRIEGVCQGESGGPLLSMAGGRPSIAGVLSGIEQGTNDHTGEPCMKPGYDMYYTPIAAYRTWIDDVMSLCSNNPDACRAEEAKGDFFLTQATPRNGWTTAPATMRTVK